MADRTIADAGVAPLAWDSDLSWEELSAPTAAEDVKALAGSLDITGGGAITCRGRSVDFTNYVGTFIRDLGNSFVIGDGTAGAGNVALKFVAGMTYTDNSQVSMSFVSTSATQQTITTAGKAVHAIEIAGAGSSYILGDAFTGVATAGTLVVTAGSFDTGGFAVNVPRFVGSSTGQVRAITLGTSVVTLTGTSIVWSMAALNLTLSAAASTIIISNTSASSKTFAGADGTYGTVQIVMGGAGVVTFTGSNSFAAINRSGTGTKTVEFTDGTTTTLTGGLASFLSGTSGNLITITGTSTGGWTISTATNISIDFVSLDYLTVTGGGILYAGTNSTDGGHNGANVVFTDPPSGKPAFASPYMRRRAA